MQAAIYCPNQHPSLPLLKRSLLMWDHVDVLALTESRTPCEHMTAGDAFSEACEMLLHTRFPTELEKAEVHKQLEQVRPEVIQAALRYDRSLEAFGAGKRFEDFLILPESKQLLIEVKLARKDYFTGEMRIQGPGMRLLRTLLTDVAAGSTKQRITDDHVCYQWVTSLLSASDIPGDETPSDNERLFSMCLRAVDLVDVRLNDIVDFRKREQTEGSGQDLRKLRHKFSEAQNSYVEKLRSVKSRPGDTEELLRTLQEEMKEDIRALMYELNHNWVDTLFSKEIYVIFLALVGSAAYHLIPSAPPVPAEIIAMFSSPALMLPGIMLTGSKFFKERREILAKHPMSYIYQFSRT